MLLSEGIKILEKILSEHGDGLLLVDVSYSEIFRDIEHVYAGIYSYSRDRENCTLISLKGEEQEFS
jgi:hypothetical protein